MIIETGNNIKIDNPTDKQIDNVIHEFINKKQPFVILSSSKFFIQCAGSIDAGYVIECKTGTPLTLYKYQSESLDAATIIKCFQEFNLTEKPAKIVNWQAAGREINELKLVRKIFFALLAVQYLTFSFLSQFENIILIIHSIAWLIFLLRYFKIIYLPIKENHPEYVNKGTVYLFYSVCAITIMYLLAIIMLIVRHAP